MNDYQNKDYIDASPPDDFDLEKCPVYQAWLAKQNEDSIKAQLQNIMERDDDNLYQVEPNTKTA